MSTQLQLDGSIAVEGDRATVTFERRYPKRRADVWDAITNPDRLAQWLDDTTLDLRVGGAFVVHFGDAPMRGTITDLEPGTLIAYSWHEGRPDASHVRWELSDDGEGTRMRLIHTRLAAASPDGFAAGWHQHLEQLESLLGGEELGWSDARFAELRAGYRATLSPH